MKRRISFGSLSMESFDSSPTGNVTALAQPLTPEQPLVTSGYTESPFSGSENYAAEAAKRIDPKKILSAPALESASEHEAQQLYVTLFKAHDCHSEADIHETFGLQPGASDAQLQKVAGHFHGKLPDLLVALLKIHNGQPAWWHSSQGQAGWSEDIYPHVCTMFGCDDMIHMSEDFMRAMGDMDEWYGPIDTDPRVKPVQWSRHWLPLASNEDHKRATTYVLDFDPGPGGKQGQVVKIEQLGNKRIVLGDNFNTWFPGLIKRHASYMSLEARTTPRYPLRKPAMEGDVVIADEDEFDALIRNANGITSLMDDSTSVSLEAKDSNKLALAKNKMHGRFKKMFEGWTDGWRTAPGLINKYRKRLEELKTELSGVIVHGPLDVNLSGLWQHFSNEAGPIHNNLVGKVHEDLQFSHYILADYSAKAFEQLTHLEKALHTGQGNSDEEAKRTALDIEKCEAPSMYLDHKWMCKAGEQPYLSVTGIGVHQGRAPRPVAISGISMDRLALMAMPFSVREYGSFLHGMKKLVVNSSKATTRLTESDLEKILSMGVEYLDGAQSYMAAYHGCWPVFRRIDESLEMIWNDFDLTDWSVNFGDEEDGDAYEVSWQTSGTGDIRRRAALYDQILGVVQNFSDAVVAPGSHEMHRAIRAAKFHCYLLEAALKVAKDQAKQKEGSQDHKPADM